MFECGAIVTTARRQPMMRQQFACGRLVDLDMDNHLAGVVATPPTAVLVTVTLPFHLFSNV